METDFNGIKIRDREAFINDLKACMEGTAEDVAMHKWMAKCIVKWGYEGDPSKEETYQELGMVAHKEVVGGFLTAYFHFRGKPILVGKEDEAGGVGDCDGGEQGRQPGVDPAGT